jgi:hypothetical protein
MNTQNTDKRGDFNIIRAKDIMELQGCGENTAFRLLKDIKDEYYIKRVLFHHFKKYTA